MFRGKHTRTVSRKNAGVKAMMIVMALALVLCSVIGGTVAWLVDATDDVVNTFTYGDINIDLEEDDTGDGDQDDTTNEYQMIPGRDIAKNPTITVFKGSEKNYLFVKLVESANFDDFLTYEMVQGWTALPGVDGVYYQVVEQDDNADQTFGVLEGDKVTVKDTVTKEMLNALNADPSNVTYPTLTVTAYAVQFENMADATAAWAAAQNPGNAPTNP